MAIMNRNPMPLSGALFVTNPRKRRNKVSKRRRNALKINRRRNALKLNRRRNALKINRRRRNKVGGADMTVAELKTALKGMGLSTKGKKAALKARYKRQFALAVVPKKKSSSKGKKRAKTGLAAKTVAQLQKQAKSMGLKRYSGKKKSALIRMIKSGKSPAAKKRKQTSWAKFQKDMAGLGLNQKEMKYLFGRSKSGKPKSDFAKMKKAIRSQIAKEALKKAGRRTRRKAMNKVASKQIQLFQNPFKMINPKRRKNTGIAGVQPLAMPIALVQDVQGAASKIPVVKFASFAITPIALGATVYAVHRLAEPHIMKFLDDNVADVPVLKETLKFPYTTTGVVAGLALGLLAKAKILDPQAASLVAASAASVGIALDLSLRPVAQAAAEVVKEQVAEKGAEIAVEASEAVEAAVAGEAIAANGAANGEVTAEDVEILEVAAANGDPEAQQALAGLHLSGMHFGHFPRRKPRVNLKPQMMRRQPMKPMRPIEKEYSDASPADAQACSPVMHPEEVAAAKAGAGVFERKFGKAPRNLRKSQSVMSRHAGKMGHRYGWMIKMLGFDNFQKIAALPAQQRAIVISQLKEQAIASIPKLIAQQQKANAQVETASVPLAGTLNGVQGFDGVSGYGAMMFAGQGY